MCGLFGIAGPGIITKDLDNFRDLGIISMLRGRQGAGIFQTKTGPNEKIRQSVEGWYKVPDSWMGLLEDIEGDRDYGYLMNNVNVDLLMGHVRYPTRGARNADNAHPFVYKNSLVGMHNGTLRDEKYMDAKTTDSELMFADMTRHGVIPVLGGLDKESAYAVTVYDRQRQKLIVARNKKRTLSFAFLEERNVMYWASESSFLRFILNRHGIKHHIYNLNEDQVFEITPSRISGKNHSQGVEMVHKFNEATVVSDNPLKAEESKEGKEKVNFSQHQSKKDKKKGTIISVDKGKVVVNLPYQPHPRVSLPQQPVLPGLQSNNQEKVQDLAKQSLKSFYTQCFCGTRHMNLMQSWLMKNNYPGMPKYDAGANKFYCEDCLTLMTTDQQVAS